MHGRQVRCEKLAAQTDACEEFKGLNRLFNPASIAIVGVSAEGTGFGRGILLSHLAVGYEGKLFPVNRTCGAIAGLPIYPSVDDIPETIDFAIIAVPARFVPSTVEACLRKGAAGVEVLSSGFRETGTPEGIALEEELKAIAGQGIRVLGPNCFGIYCPRSGQTMLPGPDLSREPGGVAFLSQSGGHSIDAAHIGKWRGIRFSKVVSFGNGCDLRETEMLRYLCQDPDTKVICMYIEGVSDGREFFSALRSAGRQKPVVVIKGGLSESGSRAAASHTASLSGQRGIWEAALRQCNAVQVENMEEMMDAALAFSLLPEGFYRGCTIMGGGGALGISAADAAESFGLTIPRLRDDIQAAIMEILPRPGSSAANPIDSANPHVTPQVIRDALISASQDKNVDVHIVISLLYHLKALKHHLSAQSIRTVSPHRELARACREAMERGKKPVVLVLPNHKQEEDGLEIEEIIRETRRLFIEEGMPVYDDVKNALRSVSLVSTYYRRRGTQAEGEEEYRKVVV
jgi:acyl-CoA synthetase (NDP forming)